MFKLCRKPKEGIVEWWAAFQAEGVVCRKSLEYGMNCKETTVARV